MNADKLSTIEQLKHFLDGTQPIAFCVASSKDERYRWGAAEPRQISLPWTSTSLAKALSCVTS